MTALMKAAQVGNLEIVKILLENKKIDPNVADENNYMANYYTSNHDVKEKILDYLCQ